MFLENWMVITIILGYGICAYFSRKSGFTQGVYIGEKELLSTLAEIKVIDLIDNNDGYIGIKPHGSKKTPKVRFQKTS